MHRLSKGWAATILMGGLSLSFVVWGIADVFTGQTSSALATVGSTEISPDIFTRSYRNFLRNQGQQMGMEITPEMAQKMNLGQNALQQLVSRTALDNAAGKMGLTTTDAALAQNVRAMPNFRGPNGQFDHNTFLQIVQNAGYNEASFLAEMRAEATRDQLTDSLTSGFVLPVGYARALYTYLAEQRAADYVILTPDKLPPAAPPGDAVLVAYVKAHAAQFSTPEYREVEYAEIAPEDVLNQVSVTDKMIAQEYAAHQSSYLVPEKRDIQQIEFPNEADAAAARAKIAGGESFEALAAARNIKPADLSLGSLTRQDLSDQARADAAFSLALNTVSQPVKGALNDYVLLRVTKITPGVSRSLDDVRDALKKSLALQLAESKLTDVANAFEDARSGGADIATAAAKSGMHAGKVAAMDRNGMTPDGQKAAAPDDPDFLAQVAQAEVGEDSDPFPAKSGKYFAIKVDGVTPPKLKSMAQVHDDALAAWTVSQNILAVAKEAQTLAAQAQKDGDLAGIAKQLKVPVQHSPALARDTNDTTFSAALIAKLFAANPKGVVEGSQGTGGNHIIAMVTGVAHPAPQPQIFDAGAQQLSQQAAQDFTVSFANAARLQQGVRVNQKLLDQTIGGS